MTIRWPPRPPHGMIRASIGPGGRPLDIQFGMLHDEIAIGTAVGLALGLLLLALRVEDRPAVRGMLVLVGLMLALDLIAAALDMGGAARGARLLSGIAIVGIGAVVIRLGGLLVFRVILPKLRYTSARIVEDLVVTGWPPPGCCSGCTVPGSTSAACWPPRR
jgi:hypothetical protein